MIEWIDNAFRLEETKYGIWHSFDKEGKGLITALHEDDCVRATRFYLKGLQEGFDDAIVSYEGKVFGKL